MVESFVLAFYLAAFKAKLQTYSNASESLLQLVFYLRFSLDKGYHEEANKRRILYVDYK